MQSVLGAYIRKQFLLMQELSSKIDYSGENVFLNVTHSVLQVSKKMKKKNSLMTKRKIKLNDLLKNIHSICLYCLYHLCICVFIF